MQLRLSNGSHSPFQTGLPHSIRKHRQQAIFTYNNKDNPPRNVYYDNNPYFLHASPSEPYMKNPISTSRNSSRSRECTDTNSQRSCKVIRANGLRLVEKPTIGRPPEQSPISPARLNDQARRFMQRELQLEAENKVLKGQNEFLRQKLRGFEESRKIEVRALQEKIEHLLQLTQNLQRKFESSEAEWKEEVRKLTESQISDV